MEWRQQSSVGCAEAYTEAQRWIEAVTKKKFGSSDFRSELENGVRLCDLINQIKPGAVRRVNRLPTPIAGLDNLNVFLKACGKLGLKEAQLFHPGDLQDLSSRVTVKDEENNRRLKNVLITIYWLGRRAQSEHTYDGPYLNFKAFEGLIGTALYKALQESSSQRGGGGVRDSGFGDGWCEEREELSHLKRGGRGREGRGGAHRRDNSLDSLDSLRAHSISSENTVKGGSSEGCCSDTEVDSGFKMAENRDSASYRRSLVLTPKTTASFNQFLPSKDKSTAYVPAPLRKKQAERNKDNRRSFTSSTSSTHTEDDIPLVRETRVSSSELYHDSQVSQNAPLQWAYEYESGSDSDADRPDPDLVLDDLASRRFHSPAPATPTNFALPISPRAGERGVAGGRGGGPWPKVTMTPNVPSPEPNVACTSAGGLGGVRLETQPSPSPRHGPVRVDHRQAESTDSLFREIYGDSEDEDDEVGYADPVQDDVYARKMGLKPQSPNKAAYDKFLPKFWTPEEDLHLQKIKLGSQRRPWYRKMQGFRQQSMPEGGDDGSKSTSDIGRDVAATQQIRFEELQKFREKVKESDDQWQNDLSKWKNRRRSVNSDIVKKKEEREKTEQITFSSTKRSKTFKEMQEERETKGGRQGSLPYLNDDDDVFEKPLVSPRLRTLPARSYTLDASYRSSEPSVPPLKEEEPPGRAASPPASPPASSRRVDKVDSYLSSSTTTTTSTRTTARSTPAVTPNDHTWQPEPPPQRSPVLRRSTTSRTEEPAKIVSSFISRQKELEPRRPLSQVEPPSASSSSSFSTSNSFSSGSFYKQQPQRRSMEPSPPAVSRVSASLPRNYQKSDSARLTSVITPRPFGSQSTRISSLSRTNPMEDAHKRVNGDADASKRSSVQSRYHQFMTPEEKAESGSSSSSDEEEDQEEEEEEEKKVTTKSVASTTHVVTSTRSVSPVSTRVRNEGLVSPAAAKGTSEEKSCEMRISLNQKPGSNRDFGFQATWDSTGARVQTVQPVSPAEMCQLRVGDEVMSVNGHKVAEMSYTEWKDNMEEALEIGSLIMDIRRHGQNNWDRDQPSLPFKSHKVINLTSTDHPTLLGSSDGNVVSPSLDFTSRIPDDFQLSREAPARPVIDVASNGVHGGFREESVTMRNKESEPISLKNLKRRSEFFETGGSESAMPDIPVPSIAPSSSRWSWDLDEERKRQEKWQKEQERLLQEKYKRDQEKLQGEWLKAQQDIGTSLDHQEPRSLEVVNSHSFSPRSPVPPTSPRWDQEEETRKREEEEKEERQRKEEQERQRQAEERRKREEEERELRRLREERERREEEERRRREEEQQLSWQRRREQEEEERRRKEYLEQQRREKERLLEQQQQQQWAAGSHNSVQPPLSFTDRTKSKSSPQLDEVEKPPSKGGVPVQPGGLAGWLLEEQSRSGVDLRRGRSDRAASELELERRNILNAMRYREPERVTGGVFGDRKQQQPPPSQAEFERQQILLEMKKKTPLLTDSSWIRQRASSSVTSKDSDLPPMRRGESLDNLDSSYNSWRSSWTPRTNVHVPNYARPHSALSGSSSFYGGGAGAGAWSSGVGPGPGAARPGSATLPSSYSMGSLRSGAGAPSAPWSRQSLSPSPSSPSPTTSPEPTSEAGAPQQRGRSVSGKKICTLCENPLGRGAAMIIESLGLCYHLSCFKCFDCKSDLGGSEAGAEVRIRSKQLYCNSCYMRFKSGQPTAM